MRIRRKNAAKDQSPEQAARTTRDHALAVIADVLHRREPQRHHASVDYAVDHAVEIPAEEQRDNQHTAALSALFDNRGRDDGGQRPSEYDSEDGVDDIGDEDGDDGSPDKGENQPSGWFRIVTIQPQKEGQVKARRDNRRYRPHNRAADPDIKDHQPRNHQPDHGEAQPHQRDDNRIFRFVGFEVGIV